MHVGVSRDQFSIIPKLFPTPNTPSASILHVSPRFSTFVQNSLENLKAFGRIYGESTRNARERQEKLANHIWMMSIQFASFSHIAWEFCVDSQQFCVDSPRSAREPKCSIEAMNLKSTRVWAYQLHRRWTMAQMKHRLVYLLDVNSVSCRSCKSVTYFRYKTLHTSHIKKVDLPCTRICPYQRPGKCTMAQVKHRH